jgi:hypothetical protein
MIADPIEPGFYCVRWYASCTRTVSGWTVAEWRVGQTVPWMKGLHGAWYVIGHKGPFPLPTFAELGEKIEL